MGWVGPSGKLFLDKDGPEDPEQHYLNNSLQCWKSHISALRREPLATQMATEYLKCGLCH